jgi:hypothetical protein
LVMIEFITVNNIIVFTYFSKLKYPNPRLTVIDLVSQDGKPSVSKEEVKSFVDNFKTSLKE